MSKITKKIFKKPKTIDYWLGSEYDPNKYEGWKRIVSKTKNSKEMDKSLHKRIYRKDFE